MEGKNDFPPYGGGETEVSEKNLVFKSLKAKLRSVLLQFVGEGEVKEDMIAGMVRGEFPVHS